MIGTSYNICVTHLKIFIFVLLFIVFSQGFSEASFLPERKMSSEVFKVNNGRAINEFIVVSDRTLLLSEFLENWSGDFIKFFSFIKSELQPVSEQKPCEKKEKTYHIFGVHWLELLLLFIFGLACGGAFRK